MSKIRVLLADAYPGLLEIVAEILEEDVEIVGKVKCGAAVLAETTALQPDIVVLDLWFGDMNGFEVARALMENQPSPKIVFLSVHESPEFIRAAEELGVSGYVFKSQAGTDLRPALLAVFAGNKYFPYKENAALM